MDSQDTGWYALRKCFKNFTLTRLKTLLSQL